MGPSGAGKSTLLHILGMHDAAWSGEYYFLDQAGPSLKPEAAGRAPQAAHRLRVSELPPARQPDGVREPRDSAVVSQREPQRAPGHGRRRAGSVSDRREEGSLSESAVGRPAAAGRRRARGHREAAGDSGRRADRQPAFGPGQGNHGAVPDAERGGHDDRAGDALRRERVVRLARSFTCATAGSSTTRRPLWRTNRTSGRARWR